MMSYLRLWFKLLANSTSRQLEFRFDFVGRALTELLWILSQILFFYTVLRQVPVLGEWSAHEIYFFIGTLFFVDGLLMVLLHDNQNKFGQLIRLGLFDHYLLMPSSSLFLSNFRFINTSCIVNIVAASCVLAYAIQGVEIGLSQVLIWVIYSSLGLAMLLAMGVMINSVAIYTTQSGNLVWLFFELYRLGWRPESFYGTYLRRFLIYVFPAAFFISIPVQLTLGKIGGWWFFAPFALFAILWMLALAVWRRALRRYDGALS
jgi:ABC-2 type transport system permease protein